MILKEISGNKGYANSEGFTMKREYGLTPNGNQMNGRWVLRNPAGEMMGFDQYRFDLACHFDIELVSLIEQ